MVVVRSEVSSKCFLVSSLDIPIKIRSHNNESDRQSQKAQVDFIISFRFANTRNLMLFTIDIIFIMSSYSSILLTSPNIFNTVYNHAN